MKQGVLFAVELPGMVQSLGQWSLPSELRKASIVYHSGKHMQLFVS